MRGAGRKAEHVEARIQQKLGAILQREANDPRFQRVTLTGIGLARDLSFAKIKFTVFPEASHEELQNLTDALNRAAGFFSRAIARTLETRITPKLQFEPDLNFGYADRMQRVIQSLDIQPAPPDEVPGEQPPAEAPVDQPPERAKESEG